MLAALIEAALRSLILALAVWAGLRIFRVHNVIMQRSAWTAVLAGSLLMPFALPFTSHWRLLSFAALPVPASLSQFQPTLASALPVPSLSTPVSIDDVLPPAQHTFNAQSSQINPPGNAPAVADSLPPDHSLGGNSTLGASPAPQRPTTHPRISFARLAVLTYLIVAAALLFRLLFGIASAMHLWHSSTRIPPVSEVPFGADLNLRWSRKISAPVTVGSGIVLPAGYQSWPYEKVRIVLAHERSHVRQHDFHLHILASLYAAVAWFSPLGWWLKYKLSDLCEAISDRSGLNAATDRSAYAQVLLEFAAAPRPTLIGVAMARPSNISRRIERLLSEGYLSRAFAASVHARIAALVAPIVLFAAAAVIHVQAATQPNQDAHAPIAHAANFQISPAATALPASYSAPRVFALAIPSAAPEPNPASQNNATESENNFDRNLTFNGKLELSVATGSGDITITRGSANQSHIHGIVKASPGADPAKVQQIVANPPIEQEGNSIRIGGHQENLHNISISYVIEAPADTTLLAETGSGNITDTGVGQNPKLETGSGNISATGLQGGFKIETGSGSIAIENAGEGDAKAETGSGTINVKGVHGSLIAETGSGTIVAAGTPSAAWKLEAGSGNIELTTGDAPLTLDASTGSGTITTDSAMTMETSSDKRHVRGKINGGGPEVRVETGSGNIRIH